jgi:pimeloyl-ACP methyl ester carboxylesterase
MARRTQVNTSTAQLTVDGIGPVPVTYTETGSGRPFLLLHGGAGPFSVAAFSDLLASSEPARVIVPVHPGFDGTPGPGGLDSARGLAAVYAQLLRALDLRDVCVIGNSIGGWIAAELALAESPAPDGRVSACVLVDAVGLQLDATPTADFFALTMDEVFDVSYYNPDAFRIDPATLTDERKAAQFANRQALLLYGGKSMADPSLLSRLPAISIPTLVVWGAADRMVPLAHGHAYADAIPGGQLQIITKAGHLPQMETPGELLAAVWEFAADHAGDAPAQNGSAG